MDKKQLKIAGIICLVVSAICLFVAVERYSTNAKNVEAINQITNSGPFNEMLGNTKMKPATPAATKYAIFFALLSGGAGCFMLFKSSQTEERNTLIS